MYFLVVLEASCFTVRMLPWLVSGEASLSGVQIPTFSLCAYVAFLGAGRSAEIKIFLLEGRQSCGINLSVIIS